MVGLYFYARDHNTLLMAYYTFLGGRKGDVGDEPHWIMEQEEAVAAADKTCGTRKDAEVEDQRLMMMMIVSLMNYIIIIGGSLICKALYSI